MGRIKEYFEEMREDLDSFESNMEKLEFIMEFGNDLEEFPKELMIEENRVPGCVSNAFIDVSLNEGKLDVKGSSDALVVKGYIAILVDGLNGSTVDEFLEEAQDAVMDFVSGSDIKATLTPSRANAFGNIFEMIKDKIENLK